MIAKKIMFLLLIIFTSCSEEKRSKVEILNINGKELLNQSLYYKGDSINLKKSHFYKVSNNCIEYNSILDTLESEIGKNRFIIFKTSDLIKPDFSNINSLKLEEFIFINQKKICLKKETNYKYGIIEDVVFMDVDTIINGERGKRIITMKQYVNLIDDPKWLLIN
jgi:hypothetical protein